MVEGTRLIRGSTFQGTEGSNPSTYCLPTIRLGSQAPNLHRILGSRILTESRSSPTSLTVAQWEETRLSHYFTNV